MPTSISSLRKLLLACSIALSLIAATLAHATDTYDGNHLTLSQVVVGGTTYTNVVITVGSVIGVAGGTPTANFDTYDSATGLLAIPSVQAYGSTYTNVTITVGSVISVGGSFSSRGYPVVDTHAHVDGSASLEVGVAAAFETMQRNGITHTILMSPPNPTQSQGRDGQALVASIAGHQDKLFVSAGGATLNATIQTTSAQSVTGSVQQSFLAQANTLAAMPFVGFGEIALRHLSLVQSGPTHPYEDTAGDHPLLFALADFAAQRGLPLDIHCDVSPQDMGLPPYPTPFFNPATPTRLTENLAAFERLLAHNRSARIIWAHAGSDPLRTRDVTLERTLLSRHPNLYMSLRIGPGTTSPGDIFGTQPIIKSEWLALLHDYPDRFVFGSDYFYTPTTSIGNREQTENNLQRIGQLLDQLPVELAKKIAYQNAGLLFRLNLQ
jgi:hypothetical protein